MLGKILTVMLATIMEVNFGANDGGDVVDRDDGDVDGHQGDAVETKRDGDVSDSYDDDCNDVVVVYHDGGYVRNDVDNDDVNNHDDNESDFTTVMMVMFVERERRKLDKSGRHAEPSTHFVAC